MERKQEIKNQIQELRDERKSIIGEQFGGNYMDYKQYKLLSEMYHRGIEDIKGNIELVELTQRRNTILNTILDKLPEDKKIEFKTEIEKFKQQYYDSLYFYAMYLKGFEDSEELKKALKL